MLLLCREVFSLLLLLLLLLWWQRYDLLLSVLPFQAFPLRYIVLQDWRDTFRGRKCTTLRDEVLLLVLLLVLLVLLLVVVVLLCRETSAVEPVRGRVMHKSVIDGIKHLFCRIMDVFVPVLDR